jgi:hypothetical protein
MQVVTASAGTSIKIVFFAVSIHTKALIRIVLKFLDM